jgi:hypothetical protein
MAQQSRPLLTRCLPRTAPQEDLASIISNTKRKRRSPPPQANGNGKD